MKNRQHLIEEKGIWLICLMFLCITSNAQKDTAIFQPEKGIYLLKTDAPQVTYADYKAIKKKDCRTIHYEIMDLYPPTEDIPWGGDDLLQMDNHLKDLGFELTDSGWGNWMNGPRFIHLELSNKLCTCSVDKKYWPYEEDNGQILDWQITEEIKCSKK